jgi:hypothetical protein
LEDLHCRFQFLHCNQNSVVLAEEEICRSVEYNWEYRRKPIHLYPNDFFCGTGFEQVLYCLSHTSGPFCRTGLDHDPPILCFLPSLGWQMCTTEMGSCKLPPAPPCWSQTLIFPASAFQVARITSLSNWFLKMVLSPYNGEIIVCLTNDHRNIEAILNKWISKQKSFLMERTWFFMQKNDLRSHFIPYVKN